ncbi:hypothetical protein EJ06DRAFT_499448 [Trichodelitschia bisporula]|uniref:GDP-mannose transporter n=1 Tax=Trichodelitschia bisporula TaxID=703511 RepID=A0A6G1HLZ9_9PEZI|nr:hypothetical protein EJ06DRAFT_499448 [Trichodelitschia bisporula]
MDRGSTKPSRMNHSRDSSAELEPGGIPLIDFSRTPSPSPYHRQLQNAISDDEDDYIPATLRPLVADSGDHGTWWRREFAKGGIGGFLYGTWLGWQVYVGLLVIWSIGVQFALVLMNRFILWTGTYKFPYPLASTWIQLVLTHIFLLITASITRAISQPLRKLGLSSIIAPSSPTSAQAGGSRAGAGLPRRILVGIFNSSGGIAGGGFFELEKRAIWTVTPLAVIYVGKVVLSNISYAYGALPLYTLSRIAIVPFTLILTATLTRASHSTSTLSSALIATLNLLGASIRKSERMTWESIVAGVFSTIFASLYPILLSKVHRQLTIAQVQQGDMLTSLSPSQVQPAHGSQNNHGTKESTRAYWQLLHYTSLLSILILSPLVLISGEVPNILRNCYFLDVPWFWFLCVCGGLASAAVFSTTLALVRATSPLTVNFIGVPRAAVQLVILSGGRLPVHAWVGVALCWLSSAWYLVTRREEGRRGEVRRMARAGR